MIVEASVATLLIPLVTVALGVDGLFKLPPPTCLLFVMFELADD